MWLKCPNLCHFLSLFAASSQLAKRLYLVRISNTLTPWEKPRTVILFSRRETLFQLARVTAAIHRAAGAGAVEIPSEHQGICQALRVLLLRFQGACRHIKASRAAASSGLGRCEQGARSAAASPLHSVVSHSGAPSRRPDGLPLQEPLPLFKNVFVLLFFLGTM